MSLQHCTIRLATIGLAAYALSASTAKAATWSFTNLSQDDVDKIEKELSANTTMHSVLPPSSLGAIFGFELGVVGGATRSPDIDTQAKRLDNTASVGAIPHAGLVGAVTTPIGLTGEATFLPQMETSGIKYQQWALGVKWLPTDSLLSMLPLNIAVRGFVARSELSFKQTQTVPVLGQQTFNVSNTNQVTGLQILASPKFLPIIEPYVGVGFLSAKGSLSQDAASAVSIFADGSRGMESKPTSTQFLAGFDVRLLLIGAGVEYAKQFGTDSLSAKLSFKF